MPSPTDTAPYCGLSSLRQIKPLEWAGDVGLDLIGWKPRPEQPTDEQPAEQRHLEWISQLMATVTAIPR